MAKILVIDDEENYRTVILSALENAGFETLEAENGARGIELARKHLPDIVLCDLIMPEVDGYETLGALQNDPSTATIPFVFLTAKEDTAYRRRGMELGADDFLTKPCSIAEVLAAIDSRLKKHKTVASQAEKKLSELRENISQALPHEIRTPLHGLLGFAEVLANDSNILAPDEISQLGQRIHKVVTRLHRTLENVLLYAQLEIIATDERRTKALQQARTNGAGILMKAAGEEKAEQFGRRADLTFDFPDSDSSIGISDRYFRKIIDELVDNAFKFSKPGNAVTLSIGEDKETILLRVQDRGRGMTAEHMASVGAYMQFDRKIHEQQGSGLGLALAKRLTELHDGSFSVQSDPGGTVVTVRFRKAVA